jgi:uncharacterized membrane protein YeiH
VPSALTNPAYLVLCVIFGIVGYNLAYAKGQLFREGLFQFMTAFSLPWYAIVGAQKGLDVGLPVVGCLLLAVVGPTAGRYFIDVTSGVTPKQFIRGEYFVTTAILTGVVWMLCIVADASTWVAAIVAFAIGFTFRVVALYKGWEEPIPKEPAGALVHEDGRPLLGRKLKGKSQKELRELGLVVDPAPQEEPAAS